MIRFVKQDGLSDCGICSLLNIIRYYGGNIDIEKLRKMTNTNENGTSIYNLVNTSNKLGFNSKAYRCNIEDLYTQVFPLIAYIKLKEFNHFVIILEIDIDKVLIFDPIRGKIKYSIEEFKKEWQNIIITFERKGELIKEKNVYIKYLFNLFYKYKQYIITIISLSILCTIFNIITSLYMKQIFDRHLINNAIIIFILLILFKGGIDYFRNKISIKFNNILELELSNKVTNKIFSLPEEYHHSRPVGDIIYRINDLNNIKDLINNITIISLVDALLLIISLLVIMFISFKIFLISCFIIFLFLVFYYYIRNEEYKYYNVVKETYSTYNAFLIDNLYGINTVKNNNIEKKVNDKKNSLLKKYMTLWFKLQKVLSIENLVIKYIDSYGLLFIMFVGYNLLNNKLITVGDLSLIYTLYLSITNSFKSLLLLDKNIIESKISINRINSFLNIEYPKDGNQNIKDINSIKFINFDYKNNSKLNLDIKKGDSILIYGVSGIGKSTIFKYLNKTYNSKDKIFINEVDINKISKSSIRNNICYISQNEYIFNDSIKNNILLDKKINNKEFEKALKVSTLDKVLKKKNINLDYLLEENGNNLSGGERKKVLIARALARDTDYIVLDETFDEIDINNERKIINNINTEYKKTLIVISHRCSNLDLYNRIIEIK